ncbi:MFS general substrate transporter [Neoconidiobolus thromboides FSU 785]|nr:MFS general substrate transporter [Neoconidiobolus thromboides FSU 785]
MDTIKDKTFHPNTELIPVTKREKYGFYVFGFATEVFYSTAMGVAIPIILETLAANAGFDSKDLSKPCDTSKEYLCKVNLAGTWYDTSAFTLYTTAVSVAFQALVFVSLSSIADYGNLRKTMLLTTSTISAIVLILFLTVVKNEHFWLAAIYTIIGNVAFGASYVFYYAYVPTLTAYSPEVLEVDPTDENKFREVREEVGNEISSKGFGASYLAAVIHLAISAGIMIAISKVGPVETYPLQILCAFAGVWMLFFLLFAAKWLKSRPGAPLPEGENYLIYSWKQTFFTFTHVSTLTEAFLFLLAWFIMSDAVSTIVAVAVIFAKKDLQFQLFELLIAAIIVPIAAGIGCVFWNFIRSRFKLTTKTMILILSLLYCLLPLYGLIGLAPSISFGLKTKVEVYIFSAYHGFLLGAIQSFYRVLYSEMLPAGKENEFFGLYEITDKGSSWIGPLVVGAISDATGSIKYGFFFLLGSMLISIFIVWFVNPTRGVLQARNFEQKEKELHSQIKLDDLQ